MITITTTTTKTTTITTATTASTITIVIIDRNKILDLYKFIQSVHIYIYCTSPHCLGCARNDVDIYTDSLTSRARNNNNDNDSDSDSDSESDSESDSDDDNNNDKNYYCFDEPSIIHRQLYNER